MVGIKILFAARPDLFTLKAGDTFQIKALQSSLQELDIEIEISTETKPDLTGFNLVHCFNILRADVCRTQCRWFKENNVKVILTPVYWNLKEYLYFNSPERLSFWELEQKKRQEIFELVDYLAPNGEKELFLIERDFNVNLPHSIIYNGVEEDFINDTDFNKRNRILSVGRIHPRKNQLNMIRAVKKLQLPVIFIGRVNDRNYFRRCIKEAEGGMFDFVEEMPRKALKKYYQQSRVHMMVSWYDTPGLVNLEAGLAGCNLVLTDRGTTRDYFKDKAFYSSPQDIEDIAVKVKKAYYRSPENRIKDMILNNYIWDKIAVKLENLYKKLLNQRK